MQNHSNLSIILIALFLAISSCNPKPIRTIIRTSQPINNPVPSDIPTFLPTLTLTPTPSCFDQDPGDLTNPGNPPNSSRSNSQQPKIEYENNNFEVFQLEMHNRIVSVAIEYGYKLTDEFGIDKWKSNKDLADFVFKTWGIYWREFGGFPFQSYSVVFGNNLPYEGGGYALGLGLSNPYSAWIAHDMYHAWNGNAFRQKGERSWYMEGVTTYYGDIRQNNDSYEKMLQEYINYYLEYYESGKDRPIGEMSMNDKDYDHQFMAQKGALVAYLLDLEMNKTGHNIGEISRKLYEQFGIKSEGHPSNEQILEIVEEVSGENFTEFFNRYIYGNEKLPITRDNEIKWICHDTLF